MMVQLIVVTKGYNKHGCIDGSTEHDGVCGEVTLLEIGLTPTESIEAQQVIISNKK